jgi:hypothetical protein
MQMRIISCVAIIACTLFVSCNKEFDPRAPLDNVIVVFSVLSTDRDAQFVRVQSSYMSPAYDPTSYTSDNSLTDAIVSIKTSNGTFLFRDTTLERSDTSRYNFPVRTFVLAPFTPIRGTTYQVIVQSASRGPAYASVLMPGQSSITLGAGVKDVLQHPEKYSQNTPMLFLLHLSGVSRGYLARLIIYYDVLKGRQWFEERAEIPVTSSDSSSYSLDVPVYPQLVLKPSGSQIGLTYLNGYYKAIINVINSKYSSNRLIFKWTTLVVLQADANLFDYYRSVHPGMDPFSIRLDEPIVSRLNGGLGVVGAYSLDSLVNILPAKFWGDR